MKPVLARLHGGCHLLAMGLLMALCLAGGCTVLEERYSIPPDHDVRNFFTGRSHYREVMARLGPPLVFSASGERLLFLYQNTATREVQLGLNIDYEGMPWLRWLKLSHGRAQASQEGLLMVFDRDGLLEDIVTRKWERDLGSGNTLELFFSTSKLVDTGSYGEELGPNWWGLQLLDPLPRGLNRGENLESGENGLELVSTPEGAGQHSLELR